MLKTQPGASAWMTFALELQWVRPLKGHLGDLILLIGVAGVCATFEIG
jgi:hypothetical protein